MINTSRSGRHARLISFCALGWICCAACAITSAAVLPAGSPKVQLKPGKAAGTFHFVRNAQATLSVDGKCELVASFIDARRNVVASRPIENQHDFTFEADLRPGTYWMTVSPTDASSADFWHSNLALRIHIDKDGYLYTLDGEHSDKPDFVIVKRINGVVPGELATADKAQPTLSWPAVSGASFYEGAVIVLGRPERIHGRDPKFLVAHDLLPDQECNWSIHALDHNGKTLAEGRGTFFGQGTKPTTISQARANQKCIITGPPAGGSYLGIRPRPAWTDKSPTRTPPVGEFSIPPGSNTDFIPGIKVSEIDSGSPAIDAGLLPDDVIVAMNDRPVPLDPKEGIADVQAFMRQISTLAPGSRVNLKVRRFPKELTITATLARFSGAKPDAPATTRSAP